MASSDQQIGTLKSVLGADLLAFILYVNSEDLNSNKISLDDRQSQVIDELSKHVDRILVNSVFDRSTPIARLLCTYNENIKTSSAVYFHYFCQSKPLPTYEKISDSSLRYLLNIARDTYPAFLVPKDRFSIPGTMHVTFEHPMQKKFIMSLVRVNNPIGKLFPDAKTYNYYRSHPGELHKCSVNALFSNGSGGTISLGMILDSMLTSATFTPISDQDNHTTYLESVKETYNSAKQLARGKEVPLKTLAGIGNIILDDGLENITSDTLLVRRLCPLDTNLVMGPEVPNMSLAIEVKQKIKLLEKSDISKENDNPFRAHDKHRNKINQVLQSMQHQIDSARMALILASAEDNFLAPTYVFSTLLNPLTSNRNYFLSPYRWPSAYFAQQSIIPDVSTGIVYWYRKLCRAKTGSVEVSIKRTISATERNDAADALIDAVMVWENLFGAKTEATLRIKSAMSLILEPNDRVKRNDLQNQIKDLYDKRSRLVHGSHDLDMSTMRYDTTSALKLSIDSFKKVLSNKKLLEAKDSETRGQNIILNIG